jgi:hypothetical protein
VQSGLTGNAVGNASMMTNTSDVTGTVIDRGAGTKQQQQLEVGGEEQGKEESKEYNGSRPAGEQTTVSEQDEQDQCTVAFDCAAALPSLKKSLSPSSPQQFWTTKEKHVRPKPLELNFESIDLYDNTHETSSDAGRLLAAHVFSSTEKQRTEEVSGDATETQPVDYRSFLIQLYTAMNPSKVCEVDEIMDAWRGQEEEMVESLREKYPRFFEGLGGEGSTTPTKVRLLSRKWQEWGALKKELWAQSDEDGPMRTISTAECRALLHALYTIHNPSKLAQIEEILSVWEGDESGLVASLRVKYPNTFKFKVR